MQPKEQDLPAAPACLYLYEIAHYLQYLCRPVASRPRAALLKEEKQLDSYFSKTPREAAENGV
jgi:hypothetical protein